MDLELQMIYERIFRESVVPDDFSEYSSSNFPEVESDSLNDKYSSIRPIVPDKISLREYNTLQMNALKEYFRNRMSHYKGVSDDMMKKFINELIEKHPEVVKKARLHIASKYPEIFDYV